MKLDISRIKQAEEECGPAALAQVLEYYGTKVPLEKITKAISADSDKWRDWIFRMGIFAMQQGFKTETITLSTDVFDPTWFDLSKEEIIAKLEEEQKFYEKNPEKALPWFDQEMKSAIEYLKKDGKISFKPTTKELIKSYLDKKIPVIASLNYTILQKWSRYDEHKINEYGSATGHVVVVAGYENNKFIVVDPNENVSETYEVEEDLLIESILRRDQQILVIIKDNNT